MIYIIFSLTFLALIVITKGGVMTWEYNQRTGEMTHNGAHYANGYSGSPEGKITLLKRMSVLSGRSRVATGGLLVIPEVKVTGR